MEIYGACTSDIMPIKYADGWKSKNIHRILCRPYNSPKWRTINTIWAKDEGRWRKIYTTPEKHTYSIRANIPETEPYELEWEYGNDCIGFSPMTRDNAGSWKNCPLISGIRPAYIQPNGSIIYLDKRDLTKDENGNIMDYSAGGNIVVEIPLWYLEFNIANTVVNGVKYKYFEFKFTNKIYPTYILPEGCIDRVQYSKIYVGAYHISTRSKIQNGKRIYISNMLPREPTETAYSYSRLAIGRDDYRERVASSYSGSWSEITWYQQSYLQALYILLFQDVTGKKLGLGRHNLSSRDVYESLHTYDNDYGMSGSDSPESEMSFFWINDWLGSYPTSIDGVQFSKNQYSSTVDYKLYDGLQNDYIDSGVSTVETQGPIGYMAKRFLPSGAANPNMEGKLWHGFENITLFYHCIQSNYADEDSYGLFNIRSSSYRRDNYRVPCPGIRMVYYDY